MEEGESWRREKKKKKTFSFQVSLGIALVLALQSASVCASLPQTRLQNHHGSFVSGSYPQCTSGPSSGRQASLSSSLISLIHSYIHILIHIPGICWHAQNSVDFFRDTPNESIHHRTGRSPFYPGAYLADGSGSYE